MNAVLEDKSFNQILIITNISLKPFVDSIFKQYEGIDCSYIDIADFMIGDTDLSSYSHIILWLNWNLLYPNLSALVFQEYVELKEEYQNIEQFIMMVYDKLERFCNAVICVNFESVTYMPISFHTNKYAVNEIIQHMNVQLQKLFQHIVDLNSVIAQLGTENSYQSRYKYLFNSPYSNRLYQKVIDLIAVNFLLKTNKIKCIVLDGDNVLWGGILCENGQIALNSSGAGKLYQDFQRLMQYYFDKGVLLTICSKNDQNVIVTMLEQHSEMILRRSHFACIMANWKQKYHNIEEISARLRIHFSQMLFIDDTRLEIEEVRHYLPEVRTIQFQPETIFKEVQEVPFAVTCSRENAQLRQITYQNDQKREELKQNSASDEEYWKALCIKVRICPVKGSELMRIAELTQRTNRCTNGIRYSVGELDHLQNDPEYQLFSVYVSDRYGDLGLVGAMGQYEQAGECKLDLFCLSCRALGRNVEKVMLAYLKEKHPHIKNMNVRSTGYNRNWIEFIKKGFELE